MMMLLSEADSNFISHGQSIFATNMNLMMLGSKGILNLTDAQDCFIATQFSQSCKHRHEADLHINMYCYLLLTLT